MASLQQSIILTRLSRKHVSTRQAPTSASVGSIVAKRAIFAKLARVSPPSKFSQACFDIAHESPDFARRRRRVVSDPRILRAHIRLFFQALQSPLHAFHKPRNAVAARQRLDAEIGLGVQLPDDGLASQSQKPARSSCTTPPARKRSGTFSTHAAGIYLAYRRRHRGAGKGDPYASCCYPSVA